MEKAPQKEITVPTPAKNSFIKSLVPLLCLLVIAVIISFAKVPTFKLANYPASKLIFSADSVVPNPFVIADMNSFKGLPVGSVKRYDVPNAWGTVIYIPQYHINPGSSADDKVNDSAQKAQNEIYQLINSIIGKSPSTNLIMVEGELYGQVPAEKIASLQQKTEKAQKLQEQRDLLVQEFAEDNLDQNLQQSLLSRIDAEIASLKRDVILNGAPEKLKADGKNVILYGAENKDTLEESGALVKDYIYLQDRQNQLNSPSYAGQSALLGSGQSIAGNQSSILGNQNVYQQLLQYLSGVTGSGVSEFSQLKTMAQTKGDNQLVNTLSSTEQVFNEQIATPSAPVATPPGSRQDNPYANVTSVSEVNSLLSNDEQKIQQLVVDRRNAETAQNFANALKTEKKNVGIIEFGAGHEKGLVKEFNKQGLSVVVVYSNEVLAQNIKNNNNS